jgi:hypothetical protein
LDTKNPKEIFQSNNGQNFNLREVVMARVKSLGKCGISEDALIWARIKKVLQKKGPDAAIQALKEIRVKQSVDKALAANQLFHSLFL